MLTAANHRDTDLISASEHGRRWVSVVTHLDPRYGGLSAVVPQLSSMLATSAGLSMSLAAFSSPGELYSARNFADLTLTEWPASRVAWLRDRSLRARFNHLLHAADGVHIHGLWEQSTMIAAQSARAQGVPYVISAHGMLERWALKNKQWKKRIYAALVEEANLAGAACLHALTSAEAQDYRRFGCTRPIAVIPNGVRFPEAVSAEKFLSHHPSLKGKRIVLFLGRIHFKKGLDLLVQAWAKIKMRHPDAHLVLAGPDFEGTRARVLKLVEEQGLTDQVLFTGMLRDDLKWSALAAAECFVLPSYSEGLSVSVLEAMGLGLPVIVTDHCNVPEVAELGAGWLIPAEVPALERALESLFENSPQANHSMGSRGREFVRSRYTWARVARQMSEVYEWVQRGTPPATVKILQHGDAR